MAQVPFRIIFNSCMRFAAAPLSNALLHAVNLLVVADNEVLGSKNCLICIMNTQTSMGFDEIFQAGSNKEVDFRLWEINAI